MFMVDGRQAPYSVGMTMAEVAASMEDLGCVQAINLDGGGSSTFATQREGEPESSTAGLTLRCRPSDGYERKVSNTIMVLSAAKPTGQFDHAVVTPNNEVYTPGSTVQFTATGIDAAGGKADIPAGASWAVLSGNGHIDANGLYTAARPKFRCSGRISWALQTIVFPSISEKRATSPSNLPGRGARSTTRMETLRGASAKMA